MHKNAHRKKCAPSIANTLLRACAFGCKISQSRNVVKIIIM